MPVGVVDALEMIDVEDGEEELRDIRRYMALLLSFGHHGPRALALQLEQPLQPLFEAAAVVESRELVALAFVQQGDVVAIDAGETFHHRAHIVQRIFRFEHQRADGRVLALDGDHEPAGTVLGHVGDCFECFHRAHDGVDGIAVPTGIDGLDDEAAARLARADDDRVHGMLQAFAALAQRDAADRDELGQRQHHAMVQRVDVAVMGELRHGSEQAGLRQRAGEGVPRSFHGGAFRATGLRRYGQLTRTDHSLPRAGRATAAGPMCVCPAIQARRPT
jgi:hypothetical protein